MNLSALRPTGKGAIPERVAWWAADTPNQVALIDAARQLTYRELERESNDLAASLREAGAGPERCIGIFLERSVDFVVAALAVLKSGAAYVPLDPSTPPDRVVSILRDAGVVALLTHSRVEKSVRDVAPTVIAIDRLSATGPRSFAPIEIDPDSLAYVVYTSGSTGRPKGVEITHASLGNLIDWHQAAFGVTVADRASHVAGLGFDAAAWEIWPHLTAGASLHIASELTRRSPEMLQDWLVAQEITIAFVPTIFAEQLLRAAWPNGTALRLLLTGGDTLQHRPRVDLPFAVINNYGPTECTVVATSSRVSADGAASQRPSIGRPIANATALILDDALRPVARGESGELCIGGALVARGYRNLPELTARRFVTYIAPSGEVQRLYRTGDHARLREDGEIEFLGRFDDQVKIRGYRIELGEIETCLSELSKVAGCAVSIVDGGAAGPALAAYIVPAPGAELSQAELREHLTAKLPEYMVPAFFVLIPALPVMANGKLDKAALPQPSAHNLLADGATSEAANGFERQIAEVVASLMGRPSIGIDENFFVIGGHSMFGVQLVARLREALGVKLLLRHVFTAPTVRELSSQIARLMSAA